MVVNDTDSSKEELPIVVHFTRKHIFSLKNNPMCGVCLWPWLTILFSHLRWVEFQYYPRMLFVSLLSVFNSFLASIEHFLYNTAIRRTSLPDDPIFIIGHPRTGTTLLHNLLASDEQHFFYATTFCVGFPSSFLWFETLGKWLLAPGYRRLPLSLSYYLGPSYTPPPPICPHLLHYTNPFVVLCHPIGCIIITCQ